MGPNVKMCAMVVDYMKYNSFQAKKKTKKELSVSGNFKSAMVSFLVLTKLG